MYTNMPGVVPRVSTSLNAIKLDTSDIKCSPLQVVWPWITVLAVRTERTDISWRSMYYPMPTHFGFSLETFPAFATTTTFHWAKVWPQVRVNVCVRIQQILCLEGRGLAAFDFADILPKVTRGPFRRVWCVGSFRGRAAIGICPEAPVVVVVPEELGCDWGRSPGVSNTVVSSGFIKLCNSAELYSGCFALLRSGRLIYGKSRSLSASYLYRILEQLILPRIIMVRLILSWSARVYDGNAHCQD